MPSGKGHRNSTKRRMKSFQEEGQEMEIYHVIDKPSRRCFCLGRFGWTVLMTVSKLSDEFRRTLNGSSPQISQTIQDDERLLVGDAQRTECRCQGIDILEVKLIL